MQLMYREGHGDDGQRLTPAEYEPSTEFSPATLQQAGLLRFASKPIKIDIGPKVSRLEL